MKKVIRHLRNIALYFFVVSVMLIGCKKPDDHPDDKNKGTASALRNGETWNAECTSLFSLQYENEVSISIDRYNSIGEKRENLSITRIPLLYGTFTVVSRNTDSIGQTITLYGSRYFSLTADGDAIDGIFHVLESESNYIEITKIDLNTKDFFGKFSITYVRDTTFNMNPDLPDTLRFTEGEFQTKIQNSW